MKFDADLVVVGGGPGGLSAARKAVLAGQKVIVINKGPLMGYGIEGAFKSKAGFEISQQYIYHDYRKDVFGEQAPPDYSMVKRSMDTSSRTLLRMLHDLISRVNVTLVEGTAEFVDPHTVKVDNETYNGKNLIIATGTTPRILPGMQIDGNRVLSSDEIVNVSHSPKSILILGAGVIGCEFACIFNAMGSEVHLVDSQKVILSNEDPDMCEFVRRSFDKRGINIISESRYKSLSLNGETVITHLDTGDVETSALLLAVGRQACTSGLKLVAAGVELDQRGYIPTNEYMQTNVDHIYAVGDVGLRNTPLDLSLVHVAQAEGKLAVAHILGESYSQTMSHVPFIIFTIPLIGMTP